MSDLLSPDNKSTPPVEAPIDAPLTSPRPATLLVQLAERHKALAAVIVGVIGIAPDLLSIPGVDRYELWAGIAIFILMTLVAHFFASPVILAGVSGLLIGAFAMALALGEWPGEGENAPGKTVRGVERPALKKTPIGQGAVRTGVGLGKTWVLHHDGDLDRISEQGDVETTFSVDGPAADMAPCKGAMLVSHDHGKLARVAPISGTIRAEYHYGRQSGAVDCAEGFAWVAKPDEGSVVKLRPRTLTYVDEFPVVGHVDSLTHGGGAIWLLDRRRRQVVGVRIADSVKLGPYAVGSDARQILYIDGSIWVLHTAQACLRRLDLFQKVERGPGIPLGPSPRHMNRNGDNIYVSDYADNSISVIDTERRRLVHRPVMLDEQVRLADSTGANGKLYAVDTSEGHILTIGQAAMKARLRPARYKRRSGCPHS